MFKEVFDGKKVAIFDLESCMVNIREVYIKTFSDVFSGMKIDWLYLPEVITGGNTMQTIGTLVLKSPYIDSKVSREQLLNVTNAKFLSYLGEKTDLDTRDGFWELVAELKRNFNYVLVLKSEYNEAITKEIISRLEMEDVFDLVVMQPNLERNDLYEDILKHLRDHKLVSKDCIAFEKFVEASLDSAKHNILTIGIKDPDTLTADYSYKVTIFQEDFSAFPGNIDKTYRDAFISSHKTGIK